MVNLFLLTGSIVDFIEPSNTNQPQFDWIKENHFLIARNLQKHDQSCLQLLTFVRLILFGPFYGQKIVYESIQNPLKEK